ncbi:sigma-70 family RNA polymerase sigma factor [Raineyella sp. W15-4]|uniref:sigma-70 family RNA polymerase sigma factor n=1 Tax=Raineyella sp. W15-4 TaxID=3081651 RepID=UPI0029542905|nr:sigma-70 family RNA polymerase sigma factor [Raineyella sp. W15-4]WOQ16068.1 sigma-70 family RNA polymerase sigma factor [Raineyella sp. W15-4]
MVDRLAWCTGPPGGAFRGSGALGTEQKADEHDEDAGEQKLIRLARHGDERAFEALFRSHHAGALRYAAHISSTLDPEDLVAEAFARVWSAFRGGGGPEQVFGPYLRTTIRNVATTAATRNREDPLEEDRLEYGIRRNAQVADDGFSGAMAEHEVVATAFNALPARWRSVLWMIDVEGRPTSDVAKDLGMSANGTAALTKRARNGLSRAWLQAHVDRRSEAPDCQWALDRIGGFVRRALSSPQEARVRTHLDQCRECAGAAHRLAHLATSLRIAALIGGGSAAGLIGLWATNAPPSAAARPSGGGSAHASGNSAESGRAGSSAVSGSTPAVKTVAGVAAVVVTVAGVAVAVALGGVPRSSSTSADLAAAQAGRPVTVSPSAGEAAGQAVDGTAAPSAPAAQLADRAAEVSSARLATNPGPSPRPMASIPPVPVPTPSGPVVTPVPVPTPSGPVVTPVPVPTPSGPVVTPVPVPTPSGPVATPQPSPPDKPGPKGHAYGWY